MAKMAVMAGEDFAILLSKLEADSEEIAAEAIYAGAEIVADQIKSNLTGVLSKEATGEMLKSFGITPIGKDKDGNWNAHVGFDGYSGKATKTYPKGTPNQLKAWVLESGSSRQRKRPFVRPAIRSTKAEVLRKMNQIIKESIEKL